MPMRDGASLQNFRAPFMPSAALPIVKERSLRGPGSFFDENMLLHERTADPSMAETGRYSTPVKLQN